MMMLKRSSLSVAALLLLTAATPASAQQQEAGAVVSSAGDDLIDNDNQARNRSFIVEDSLSDSFNTDNSLEAKQSFNTSASFNKLSVNREFEDSRVIARDSNSTYRNVDVAHESIFAAPVANAELVGVVKGNNTFVGEKFLLSKVTQDNSIDLSGSLTFTGISTLNVNTGANARQQATVSTSVVAIGY
jgi:hypothetical protein